MSRQQKEEKTIVLYIRIPISWDVILKGISEELSQEKSALLRPYIRQGIVELQEKYKNIKEIRR